MSKRTERPAFKPSHVRQPQLGFALRLTLRPGMAYAECRQIERWLEDYAERQGLQLTGHQLHQFVVARDRAVTVADQVALIDRLVNLPGLVAARLGPIVTWAALPAGADTVDDTHEPGAYAEAGPDIDDPPDDAFIEARSGDHAVIGLTLLYRSGRLSPELYLQILGGFVRRVDVH